MHKQISLQLLEDLYGWKEGIGLKEHWLPIGI